MFIKDYPIYLGYLFARKVCPFIWSTHGVGKTQSILDYCAANGYKLFNLRLGNMSDLGDLLGLGDFVKDDAGNNVATKFMMPNWQKEMFSWCAANPDKLAIIHLDEATRVPKHMLNPVLQIALENRLHENVFPDNVRVVCSGNPPTKDYDGVIGSRDKAFWDRFCHLKLEPTTDEWLSYMRSKGQSSPFVDFFQEHPHLLRGETQSFTIEDFVSPSARSAETAALLYADGAPQELVLGLIGGRVGSQIYQWIKDNQDKVVTTDDILAFSDDTAKQIRKLLEQERRAEIASINTQLITHLQEVDKTGKLISQKHAKAICSYAALLPDDVFIGLCLNFIKCRSTTERVGSRVDPKTNKEQPWAAAMVERVLEIRKAGKVDVAALTSSGT